MKLDNKNNESKEEDEEHKLHITRVPTWFTEEIVKRILQEKLSGDNDDGNVVVVKKVELIYPRPDDEDDNEKNRKKRSHKGEETCNKRIDTEQQQQQHRGFGFVHFPTAKILRQALALQTVKGGKKATSKRTYMMHLRPYARQSDEQARKVCYLWSQHRCPYDKNCKFAHTGPGGCRSVQEDEQDAADNITGERHIKTKKRGKCFPFKTKGKCNRGDDCPFSHDFEPPTKRVRSASDKSTTIPKSEKDCITWKTKGKCPKHEKRVCEYRHDPAVLSKLQKKKIKKKAQRAKMGSQRSQKDDAANASGDNNATTTVATTRSNTKHH